MSAQTPSLAEVLENAMDERLSDVWTAAVGRIVSWDPDSCSASIQITTKQLHTREDGTSVASQIPILPNVPVIMPGSGNDWGVSFPVVKGDVCLVVFSTLPLDAWKFTTDRVVAPKLGSLHCLNNAIAIVGLRSLVGARAASMTPIPDDAMVLWTESGKELRLGHGSANDPVCRKSDLDAVVAGFNSKFDTYNLHTHVVSGTAAAAPVAHLVTDVSAPACSAVVKAL